MFQKTLDVLYKPFDFYWSIKHIDISQWDVENNGSVQSRVHHRQQQ